MAVEWDSCLAFDLREGSTLNYTWQWGRWLAPGVGIDSFVITPESGLSVTAESRSGANITMQVTGLDAGESAYVTCTITTDEADPQTESRAILIRGIAATD